ncbi:MAG: FtsX-like permease family protein, partial [Gammaproteobacteria bacterium]|nr:FtsX-like permease family protein [Gemmatimonadota bacterium]NIU76895.1 FtsX-like permease family protein [Gammaproteobacteria bacterium]NIX22886.1 FtsX-like permease family protein [Actinomycetota bacterium]
DAIAGRLAALYPETNAGDGALVTPLQGDLNDRNTKLALWTLLGAVGFVLLIACANLANLMLARASRRSKEVAIRASLGADRSRLVRQFLGESLVVALVGGTVGLAIAFGGLDLIVGVVDSAIDGTVQGLRSAHVSGAALAFTAGVCAIVWLLVGLAPALQGSRLDV